MPKAEVISYLVFVRILINDANLHCLLRKLVLCTSCNCTNPAFAFHGDARCSFLDRCIAPFGGFVDCRGFFCWINFVRCCVSYTTSIYGRCCCDKTMLHKLLSNIKLLLNRAFEYALSSLAIFTLILFRIIGKLSMMLLGHVHVSFGDR